jgi:NAD(P)-dependent dehydrogenase (short-subunit alcohol dehydrogenase family)
MSLANKVVLITGGGSGMGQFAARQYAQQGAKVALLDVNEAGMAQTADGQANIHSYKVDVTDLEQMRTAIDSIESDVGPIFRVMNCAAIMPFGKLVEQDPGLQAKIMDINWKGLVNITNTALNKMLERNEGEFVSFASMAGIIPTLLTGAYSASKAAVMFYTETLYHEHQSSKVQFACVCPPTVATPLLEQARDNWPKMLDAGGSDYLTPADVIGAVEDCLAKDKFMVFPNRDSKIGSFVRRFAPGLIWKQVHKTEGW